MKKKDFINKVKRAKSNSKSSKSRGLTKVANAYIDYLKSPYSENAIKFIERWIVSKYDADTNVPPQELHELFLETARYYVEHDRLEDAEEALTKILIVGTQNLNIADGIREQINIIKMKRALLEKGEIDEEAMQNLDEIAYGGTGKFTSYNMATTYFSEIPVQYLNADIFPANMRTAKSF